ncbi:FadR family transcriptional regulator [Acidisoma cellulosilytica]|uniref:FadR family transcriptional regulator n=1 Tax=Acidisoma cellulosilyticum TaxID=2802395 RepID=A0A964E790_9PROT|nr:FadR/GntR family transcriptional regulator [Acidisoma cellulosilyticum]MCB8883758.1 FadR family transcriptional regulator [Acidisoma cellulosilyticum]
MQVGNNARPRVHQNVLMDLARRILSGEIPAGSLLPSMQELSDELGVSRSAMREAIKVLSAKGMVEVRPRTGTRVRPRATWNLMDPELLSWSGPELDQRFLTSLLQCRLLIEPGAAALAAANATAAQLAVMEDAFHRMQNAKTLGERVEADLDFHVAVLSASGNIFLEQWGSTISSVLLAAFRISTETAMSGDEAFSVHGEVLEAIRMRSEQRADRAMRRLLTVAAKDLHVGAKEVKKVS